MKIWWGYGSEHSMNLVMIGKFASAGDAEATKELIDKLAAGVQKDIDAGHIEVGEPDRRFSPAMLDLLMSLNVHYLSPADLEQLVYDTKVVARGDSIVIRTDESDVQAILKIFVSRGARIDVFSAHDYPGEEEKLADDGAPRRG
ncbi:DUF6375 family protein [Nonomuraea sp. AD125B]|uniref:DUF6375 family protein n=1 Tax=Nonomuraea sp. AD125B TaxID=3242897 RepID=UPI0035296B85